MKQQPWYLQFFAIMGVSVGSLMVLREGYGLAGFAAQFDAMTSHPMVPDGFVSKALDDMWPLLTLKAAGCLLGIAAVASGIGLLRLREWGRRGLELSCWGAVAWVAGFAWLWESMAVRFASAGSWRSAYGEPALTDLPWSQAGPIIAQMLVILAIAIPFVWAAKKLRSYPARDAVHRATLRELAAA